MAFFSRLRGSLLISETNSRRSFRITEPQFTFLLAITTLWRFSLTYTKRTEVSKREWGRGGTLTISFMLGVR